jgi:hypothetical protein
VPLWGCLKAGWLHTRCSEVKSRRRCMTILQRHSIGLDNYARDVSRTWLKKKRVIQKISLLCRWFLSGSARIF